MAFANHKEFATYVENLSQGGSPAGYIFTGVSAKYDRPEALAERQAVAGNFLREARLPGGRESNYIKERSGWNAGHSRWSDWHFSYLKSSVNLAFKSTQAKDDEHEPPAGDSETFGAVNHANSRHLTNLGADTCLVRFQGVRPILEVINKLGPTEARQRFPSFWSVSERVHFGWPHSKSDYELHKARYDRELSAVFVSFVVETLFSPEGKAQQKELDDVLKYWFVEKCMSTRPTFAMFRHSVQQYVPDQILDKGTTDPTQIAQELGNALLAHGMRDEDNLPQLVFVYTVKALIDILDSGLEGGNSQSKARSLGSRARYAVPTVLDYLFDHYFCPIPTTYRTGKLLNLLTNNDSYRSHCEVIHPGVFLDSSYIRLPCSPMYAGSINGADMLSEVRANHFNKVQSQPFCTDGCCSVCS